MLNIQKLVDDSQCYSTVRQMRWSEKTVCPHCESEGVKKRGKDDNHPERQRYHCKSCEKDFDDLTNTIFSGHHQPLKTWILCLYFMGLNLSNRQIAQELNLNKDDVHSMTEQLRTGIEKKRNIPNLSGEVECDEVYIVAGHKGNPDAVKKSSEKAVETG